MRVAGVDDAGRGPIIGPLVIAGVMIDEMELPKLKDLGVKDSKLLSPQRRELLAVEIRKLALKCKVEVLSPAQVDKVVETGRKLHRLNRLEARTMAKVIAALKPEVAYVDASDILADRYKEHILEDLSFKVQIISEHKADRKYLVVAAASIIAKTEREKAIRELKEKYASVGDMGSGYASDPRTIQFLERWFAIYGSYPEFVRKSWKPVKELSRKVASRQMKLE